MILYRLPDPCDPQAAARCDHPKLARLKGAGPWSARAVAGGGVDLWLMLGSGAAWPSDDQLGEERQTHDGLTFRLAKELPPLESLAVSDRSGAVQVRLFRGITIPVMPAYMDGYEITAAGVLGGVVGRYGQLVNEITDRATAAKKLPPVIDPQMLELARLALASCFPRLTAETIEAYKLLTTRDVYPLFEAAITGPKLDPAADG